MSAFTPIPQVFRPSPVFERRARRSDDRSMALRYQLEHTLQYGKMEAVALADARGMLIASGGVKNVCEELGAFAPLIARSVLPLPRPESLRGADIAVRSVDTFGDTIYLATVGGTVARDALLAHAVSGLERILRSN